MAAKDQKSRVGDLYDRDFVLWTEAQAAALRHAKHANLPLDWENLAEEIESLGKSDRRELRSQIRRILHHLLKLEASPAVEPRAGWCSAIRNARAEIDVVLRDSPSLRREIDAMIAEQFGVARELAEEDPGRHGEPSDTIEARPARGGFTADQVLGDWFPESPA
jgi:hypothetical protein